MLTSFSQFYFCHKIPFTTHDPIYVFGLNKENIELLKMHKFVAWSANYNLGINKSGTDAFANPFNLPNIVSALLPLDATTSYVIILHITMALMGFSLYLLLSYLGFSRIFALLGGVIYMFNPMTDEHHSQVFWAYAYIFTPIGAIFIHEWFRNNKPKSLIFLLGLLGGLLYLAAGINVLLYVLFGIWLYSIMLCLVNHYGLKQFLSITRFLFITGLISLSIGAYIFIPGVDAFVFKGERLKIINTSFFYFSQFSWRELLSGLLSFIFPWEHAMFMTNFDYGFSNDRALIRIGNYWNYLNILILPAIAILLTNWKNIRRSVKGSLVFLLVYYAIFLNPSLINPDFILKIFPFYTFTKNYPIYYIGLVILILNVIGDLNSGKLKFNRGVDIFIKVFASFYFLLSLLFLIIVFTASTPSFIKLLRFFYDKFGHIYGGRFSNVLLLRLFTDYTFQSPAAIFIFLLLFVRGLQLMLFRKFNYKYFSLVFMFLIAVEYLCFTRVYYPFMQRDTLDFNLTFNPAKTGENRFIHSLKPGTRIARQHARLFSQEFYPFEYDKNLFNLPISEIKRISQEKHKFDYFSIYALPFPIDLSIFGVYNMPMEKNLLKYYSRMAKGNLDYEEELKNNFEYVHSYLYYFNENSPLTRPIYSYLITQRELTTSGLTKVLNGKYYNIYRNDLALPRAYFVAKTIYEPDISKSLDMLEDKNFKWLDKAIVHDNAFLINASPGGTPPYIIRNLKIIYDDVEIEIENSSIGILIINDLFYPYWEAYDNGRQTDLFRVNCIFRGIRLEPGRHIIKMKFNNPKLTVGLWVSGISIVSCVAMIFFLTINKMANKNSVA